MHNKGQLFSLDLIIAIALIVLAIGLLYKQFELFHYFQKDDSMLSELYRIGFNASNQLVSNQKIVCQLIDSSGNVIDYLPNCIPKNQFGSLRISKENLGIPSGFGCKIEQSLIIQAHECNGDPSNAKNVFSITRKIVSFQNLNNYSITKSDFDNCVKDSNCSFTTGTITLKVWKE